MHYTAILSLQWAATWALLLTSFFGALLANGLDRARRAVAVRVAVLWLLAGTGLVCAVAIAGAGVLAWTTAGWDFAAPMITVAGVLAGPAAAVALITLPALVRPGRTDSPVERRCLAAAPRLVTPLHALAVAAVVAVYRVFIIVAQPPYVDALASGLAVIAAATGLSIANQRAIAARRSAGQATTRARAARWAIVLLAGIAPAVGFTVRAAQDSRLPDSYAHGTHQDSSLSGVVHRSVTELTGPAGVPADRAVTLTAQAAMLSLDDESTVDAWTFNGVTPGPLLRVTVGELLQVTLVNRDVPDGVTIHWHGVEVPGAEDGVAGVTQDAVQPGESHVYRFRPMRAGTYWYHSHQASSVQVARGLYGVLIVDPVTPSPSDVELVVPVHTWTTGRHQVATVGLPPVQHAPPGATVRLRLVNTDITPTRFVVDATPIRLVAVDGNDINGPSEFTDLGLLLAAGGRYDITFTMPQRTVTIRALLDARERKLADRGVADPVLVLTTGTAGTAAAPALARTDAPVRDLDLATYGRSTDVPFTVDSQFQRHYTLRLDWSFLSFYDGGLRVSHRINGRLNPDTPVLTVREGDLVRLTIINRTADDHPMHLHGHTALVLARNGGPTTGSPWWTDTLNVAPGESYDIAFRADNPGIWMDHCHNLDHAAAGMTTHLAYEGVHTPYRAGRATGNTPE